MICDHILLNVVIGQQFISLESVFHFIVKETRMKNESVSSCGRQDFNYLISTSSPAVWLDCAKNFSCVFLTWVLFPQTC